jgi:hypothetical protein
MNTLDTIREMIAEREGIDINLIKPETTLEELNIDSLELFDLLSIAKLNVLLTVLTSFLNDPLFEDFKLKF